MQCFAGLYLGAPTTGRRRRADRQPERGILQAYRRP